MVWILLGILLAALVGLTIYDLIQRKHAILRNFPIIGHFRYWFEAVGPELRQYIVTSNNEERPFSRDQRRWVYASSKNENNYFGFGTDEDIEFTPNYIIIKQAAFPMSDLQPGDRAFTPDYRLPGAKVLGQARGRRHAFRPKSAVNISGMSFGSLSAAAVEALNRGAKLAGCLHNTGEGGVSDCHRCGGELIWQIGTGYFGCRDERGGFSLDRFKQTLAATPTVRAIEIKLSQGAKPGMGGLLPAAKVTPQIARIRGIPVGRDCHSPPGHSEFDDVDSMLDFVEMLAEESGLPVGIKSAVGEQTFWVDLASEMESTRRGVDFITIDGGEGGTGAAPLVFSDHVALPFKLAFARVYPEFRLRGIDDRVVFIGSGKLGFPETALLAFALGCDMINVGREAMLSIGCIQAQRCHTGRCPTGVATQNRWLMRGLDPALKSTRLANYIVALRRELIWVCRASGVPHPACIHTDHLEILGDHFAATTIEDTFGYESGWGRPSPAICEEVHRMMNEGCTDLRPAAPEPSAAATSSG